MKILLAIWIGLTAVSARAEDLPGKAIFERMKCAGCHMDKANQNAPTGNPGMAKILGVDVQKMDFTRMKPDATDADLHKTIEKGKEKMPAYGKKLKPEEIDALAAYVRTLAAAPKKQ